MQKIKNAVYLIATSIMISPLIVWAQPEGDEGEELDGWRVPTSAQAGNLSTLSFYSIIQNLLFYLLGIIGVLAIVGIVIAGIMYITAVGEEERVENAKKMLTYSITGLVVALVGLVIVIAVDLIVNSGEGGEDGGWFDF